MSAEVTETDRAQRVRGALLELVAERGLDATAMSAVAARAGVAVGTIYVHYADKEELIVATYKQLKRELGLTATAGWDPSAQPREQFLAAWRRFHAHLIERPERAGFLLQLEASRHASPAQEAHDDTADVWAAAAEGPGAALVDLPQELLYLLGFGPAVALAARSRTDPVAGETLESVAEACWRAVSR